MEKIKWGIMGLGNMAYKIADALEVVENAELIAAGSRSEDKAQEFGEEYGLAKSKCYGDYQELASDDDIDVIYIATPVALHKENAIMCMEEGKAVLCEKSLAENAADVAEMIKVSKDQGVFFMEAMWTRFLPVYKDIKKWLAEGNIGDIRMIDASITINDRLDPYDIRFDPELGGGALLDLGIYPISFCSYILNESPETVSSEAYVGKTGVDEQVSISFGYNDYKVASMNCSMFAKGPGRGVIIGTKGRIEIEKFWYSSKAELYINEEIAEIADRPHEVNGYEYELREVVSCLLEGKEESDIMPRQESIDIMKTMDKVRLDWVGE